jgi:DNA repair protein RecO (recombination protein O)
MTSVAESVHAFVLHRRPYSETSFIVELWTEEHGRVGVMARGERKRSAQGRGALQPFQLLNVSWRGRGELPNLVDCEAESMALRLQGKKLISALYVNELLMRLLQRHDPHPSLWQPYADVLQALNTEASAEPPLRIFEKRLLASIGYGLELTREGDTGAAISANQNYAYDPQAGPRLASGPQCVSGTTLLALAAENLSSPTQLREAKMLMRNLLDVRLEGRALSTRKLIRS